MVDVVHEALSLFQTHQVLDYGHEILLVQDGHVQRDVELEPLIYHVPADLAQIVALGGEEEPLQQTLGHLLGRRLPRSQQGVYLHQRLYLGFGGVLVQGVDYDVDVPLRIECQKLQLADSQLLQPV